MLKVGITGCIGSGKTEVCKILEELGAPVIYADTIAKDLLDEDEGVKRQVIKLFGTQAYNAVGKVDRKLLARKIFFDEKLKHQLEKIVHPVVIEYILKKISEIQNNLNYKVAFVEAALIFETEFHKNLDYTIVVDSDIDLCVERVIKRDKISKQEVINRIKSQLNPQKKLQLADFIIKNNSSLAELKQNVKFIYNLLIKISNKHNGTEIT